MRIRVTSLVLLLGTLAMVAAGAFFLLLVGGDSLEERNQFQFFADSNTYHKIHRGEAPTLGEDRPVVGVSANYLGPITVLNVLDGNIYLVLLFNAALLFLSVTSICARLRINPLMTCCLLLLSPLTVSSILSVNKEIFLFPFFALALSGYVRRSATQVLAALCISVLVRWQLTLFYLVFLMLVAMPRVFRSRISPLVLLLTVTSVGYAMAMTWLQPVLDVVDRAISDYEGSGIFESLLNLQNQGFYWLVFPAKAVHLLFGLGFRVDRLIAPVNIYNDVFVLLHSSATLIVYLLLLRRRLARLRYDLFFLSVVYLIVFALSPVYAPRYLYLVFVIWVFMLAGAPRRIPRRLASTPGNYSASAAPVPATTTTAFKNDAREDAGV